MLFAKNSIKRIMTYPGSTRQVIGSWTATAGVEEAAMKCGLMDLNILL